jgi:hypothetical protein
LASGVSVTGAPFLKSTSSSGAISLTSIQPTAKTLVGSLEKAVSGDASDSTQDFGGSGPSMSTKPPKSRAGKSKSLSSLYAPESEREPSGAASNGLLLPEVAL